MQEASRNAAIQILNDANLSSEAPKKVAHITQLKELLVRKDPTLLPEFLPEMVTMQVDPSPSVRKALVAFLIEAAMATSSARALQQAAASVSAMFADSSVQVQKAALVACNLVLRAALAVLAARPSDPEAKACWGAARSMQQASAALVTAPGTHEAVRLVAVKLLEGVVLLLSGDAAPLLPSSAAAGWEEGQGGAPAVPPRLPQPAILAQDAAAGCKLLAGLLRPAAVASAPGPLTLVAIRAAAAIATARPSLLGRLLPSLITLAKEGGLRATGGPAPPPLEVRGSQLSLGNALRSGLVAVLRGRAPAGLPWRERVAEALRGLGAGQAAEAALRAIQSQELKDSKSAKAAPPERQRPPAEPGPAGNTELVQDILVTPDEPMAEMLEDMPVNPQDFERTPAEMEEALEDDDGEDVTYGSDEVGKEVKVTPDGGIVKKILVQGSGWDKPEAHDVVTVHYVGTLTDGTTFDSSRDRNEPFTFTLGEGRVIKGWDQGVATMKKGEKAVLTCAPDYAYGASGSPPKIPPNATLNFEVELLSWQSVKDIMGDGGVIKTTTVEGSGWENPNDMDEALVKFSARVPGASQPFAQSGAEPTQFLVGQGLLGMKGTSVAVKKMKKGETAKLLLKPEYAFGPEGRPALEGPGSSSAVPPDANVEVDLELVGWHKVENVSDDGGVVKKTLVESSEWKRPNEGAKVTLRGVGRLEDGTVFDEWAEGSDLTFTTDEEQVPLGLDLAVQKMKQGEKALVTCSAAYAYGSKGHAGRLAQVPADASVSYELELVSFENAKETWEMSDADKVAAAVVRKDKGNAAYKAGNLARAVHQYDKAVSLLSVDKSFPEDIKAQAKEVRKSAALNLAAAHLKQQSWAAAAKEASRVLEQDSFNVKALYRRAQAYIGTADFAEAEADVKKGLSVEPGNADLAALLKKLKVLMREQNKKEAALYSRMFKFPAAVAPKTAPVVAAEAVSTEQLASGAAPEQATAAEADLPTMTATAPEPAMVEAH